MSQATQTTQDTQATQVWKNEVRYTYPEQVGHVIGYGGINVKHWLNHHGCSTIIDNTRKRIVIIGNSENAILQTTIEVQDKLMLYWQFSHYSLKQEIQDYRLKQEKRVMAGETSQYLDFDTIIEGKDLEIVDLKQEIQEYRLKLEKSSCTPKGWPENEPYWN
jgi:hypothetical protein